MESKIRQINDYKFLGGYMQAQSQAKRFPDNAVFATGAIATWVLPQIGISLYGGFKPLVGFASIALVGIVSGLYLNRRGATPLVSCVPAIQQQVPTNEDRQLKKVA